MFQSSKIASAKWLWRGLSKTPGGFEARQFALTAQVLQKRDENEALSAVTVRSVDVGEVADGNRLRQWLGRRGDIECAPFPNLKRKYRGNGRTVAHDVAYDHTNLLRLDAGNLGV